MRLRQTDITDAVGVDRRRQWLRSPECEDRCNSRLQRMSAKEDHAAFILATWRDVQKGEHVDEWAQAWRSCCMKLVYLANDSEAFWHHVRSRERIGEYLSPSTTALPRT